MTVFMNVSLLHRAFSALFRLFNEKPISVYKLWKRKEGGYLAKAFGLTVDLWIVGEEWEGFKWLLYWSKNYLFLFHSSFHLLSIFPFKFQSSFHISIPRKNLLLVEANQNWLSLWLSLISPVCHLTSFFMLFNKPKRVW